VPATTLLELQLQLQLQIGQSLYAVAAQRGSLPLADLSIVLCDLEEGSKGLWVLQQLCYVCQAFAAA
jgi:hypothetical protein